MTSNAPGVRQCRNRLGCNGTERTRTGSNPVYSTIVNSVCKGVKIVRPITVRELLYPLKEIPGCNKLPLEIFIHANGQNHLVHRSDNAAGMFKMQGAVLDYKVKGWHLLSDKMVINLGICSHILWEGRKERLCMMRSVQKPCKDGFRTICGPCNPDSCPLADEDLKKVKE